MQLDSVTLRVLGALIEKEITTPELYPLSLNALVNACNQRSSRDPVMNLEEEEIREALEVLFAQGLASVVRDGRVPKYEHRVRTVMNLRRDETAIVCLLLLRGPQTPGELRSRAERLFSFEDLPAVQSALDRLARRDGTEAAAAPLVVMLARQPGSREARYAHLLGDPVPAADVPQRQPFPRASNTGLDELAEQVAMLRQRIERIEQQLAQNRQ